MKFCDFNVTNSEVFFYPYLLIYVCYPCICKYFRIKICLNQIVKVFLGTPLKMLCLKTCTLNLAPKYAPDRLTFSSNENYNIRYFNKTSLFTKIYNKSLFPTLMLLTFGIMFPLKAFSVVFFAHLFK